MISILLLIIIGVIVGILTGITGASGVLVVVPALTFLGIEFSEAVGTSLLVDVITTSIVILVYMKGKKINLKVGGVMGMGAVMGALMGDHIAIFVNSYVLEIAFTVFIAIMSYSIFRKASGKRSKMKIISFSHPMVIAAILSVPIGILTGILGTSGGVMFIIVMLITFAMVAQKMVGTATLAMFFSALSGAGGYIFMGRLDIVAAIIIGTVALFSGFIFSKLALRMKESTIYYFLGIVFIIVVISEIMKIISTTHL